MMRIIITVLLLFTLSAHAQKYIVVAGNGLSGYAGNGVPATAAQVSPIDVVYSRRGNLYIADNINHVIRKVNPAGVMTTVAGNHIRGNSGDGGPATAASLSFPTSVDVDNDENLYIATYSNFIRKVDTAGIISTIAGGGNSLNDGVPATDAQLWDAISVSCDHAGNVYIGDQGHNKLRKVSRGGIITTIAGTGISGYSGDNGPATSAQVRWPSATMEDTAGNLYFADYGENVVRKINTSGTITTIAGNNYFSSSGVGAFSGDGGPATAACLNGPTKVARDKAGNIYIADFANSAVRKVDTAGNISTAVNRYITDFTVGITLDSADNILFTSRYRVGKYVANCIPGAIVGADSICIGDAEMSSDIVKGGLWTLTNNNAIVNPSGLITGMHRGNDTLIYSISNVCGTYSVSKQITVDAPENISTILGPDSICTGGTVILTDSSVGGIWSASNMSASISSTGKVTGLVTGVETIRYTKTNTCGTFSRSKAIRVNELPFVGNLIGPDSVCEGASIYLSDSALGGNWYSNDNNTFVINGLVTGTNHGIDTIYYSISNSCGSVVAKKGISVLSLAHAGTITGLKELCPGSTISLSESVSGGIWHVTNATATISFGTVLGVVTGIDTVLYEVTNSCGSAVATGTVAVSSRPYAGSIEGPAFLCVGDSTILTDDVPGGMWIVDDNFINIIDSNTFAGVFQGSSSVRYAVSNTCGTDVAQLLIEVVALPADSAIMRRDKTLYVTAGDLTYHWMVNGNLIPGANSNEYIFVDSGSYSVIVTNSAGCSYYYPQITLSDSSKPAMGEVVYPNPADNILHIVHGKNRTGKIISGEGRKVKDIQNMNDIDISDLAEGIYSILLFDEFGKKFLSQRLTVLRK